MFQSAAMFPTALRLEPFHAPWEHYLHSHKGIHIGRDGSVIRVGEGIYDIMHRRFSRVIHFDDSGGIGLRDLIGLYHSTRYWEMIRMDPISLVQRIRTG